MLAAKLIPTPLVNDAKRPAIAIVPTAAPPRFRSFRVVFSFVKWGVRTYWRHLRGELTGAEAGRSLRQLLETHGFLWVKVGQLLSLRSDAFPLEFCQELSQLQFQAKGFPYGEVRRTIEEELGGAIEDFFSEFEEQPFAAASISQVHRAVLRRNGAQVAVKIQRPDVTWIFERDIKLIGRLLGLFEHFHLMRQMRWDDMLWELNQIMLEEIDYRYETANIRHMRRNVRTQKVYVPRVYEEVSYRRVLTMEYIQGLLMSDFITLKHTDPARLEAWLADNNVDPHRVGRRLFLSFFRQLMEDNFFHGDLHPGNIVLLRDSRFVFIDLGSVGTLDTEFLALYMQTMEALASYQFVRGSELSLLLCPDLPPINLGELLERLTQCYREWEKRAHLHGVPYHERSMASVTSESSQLMFSYGVVGSMSFLKLSRTWATLDASLNYLMPEINYGKLIPQYFKEKATRDRRRGLSVASVLNTFVSLKETFVEFRELIEPTMRHRTLLFRGGTSTLAFTLAALFGTLRLIAAFALILCVFGLLEMSHHEWFDGLPFNDTLHRFAVGERLPTEPGLQVLTLLGLGMLYACLSRLVRVFRREEIRLPAMPLRT